MWEYATLTTKPNHVATDEQLTHAGQQDWELVTIEITADAKLYRFKRRWKYGRANTL